MRFNTFACLLPALCVAVFFFAGLLLTAWSSLQSFEHQNFTISAYKAVLLSRETGAAFVLTVWVAVVSTALAAVCGLMLALALNKFARQNALLKTLLQIPLAVPHLAAALVLLNLLQPSGLIARFFVAAPQDFPVLVNDAYGIGIAAAFVLKETAFVAVVLLATLARRGDELGQVAKNLGATRWQRFRFVALPTLAPALKFASLIVFAFVFGAFEIGFVLGRQFPAMLAVVGNRKFLGTDLNEKPEAFALAVLMTIAAGVFVWLYLRVYEPRI